MAIRLNGANRRNLAAPCGLYCGACIAYLVSKTCHGCMCTCGNCDAKSLRKKCRIHSCCFKRHNIEACCKCKDFPCSLLTQFCHDPVWTTHSTVIENLRRRKKLGTDKWLEEQARTWRDRKYLCRWLWLQEKCMNKSRGHLKESKHINAKIANR
jgi:hypothetical protein